MDSHRSQAADQGRLPAGLYFNVEDRRGGVKPLNAPALAGEKNRRFGLSEAVIETANQMTSAVRSLRAFDKTGNAGSALDHIEDLHSLLGRQVCALVADVEKVETRYQDSKVEWPQPDTKAQSQSPAEPTAKAIWPSDQVVPAPPASPRVPSPSELAHCLGRGARP